MAFSQYLYFNLEIVHVASRFRNFVKIAFFTNFDFDSMAVKHQ